MISRRSSALLCFFASTALTAAPAVSDVSLVTVDVLTGWSTEEGTHMGGLRLDLADGWKTYWRSPGDTGIPPQFDWSDSENIADVRIHWPRPEVFDTYGQRSIGYGSDVILPVEVTPADPSKPIRLHGQASLGVCHDVCVPVHTSFGYSALPEIDSQAIRAALSALPDSSAMVGASCKVEPIADGLRITATLDAPQMGGSEVTVFELSDPSIWVSETTTERRGRTVTAVAEFVPPSATPFVLDRSEVRITLLGSEAAAETLGCTAG
ncbi:MAG: protein-disulfide reductase DsbD domain-containing protein [Pseudomonadota bacterium]